MASIPQVKPRDTVWRYAFAVKGSPQILGGWGQWKSRRGAERELRRVKRRAAWSGNRIARLFQVRRVRCLVVLPPEYVTGDTNG